MKPENTRRNLSRDTISTFGVAWTFKYEMSRLAKLGLTGERQFRLAALNVFGRSVS